MSAATATSPRELGPSDADTLAALAGRLGTPDDVRTWRDRLERPGAIAVGAVADGRLVGYAVGEVRAAFGLDAPVAWLEAFGIELERRGGGMGRALLEAFLEHSARGGAARALTLVPFHDRVLGPFFRAAGFRDEALACLGRAL